MTVTDAAHALRMPYRAFRHLCNRLGIAVFQVEVEALPANYRRLCIEAGDLLHLRRAQL
jgi:hypothetical protein